MVRILRLGAAATALVLVSACGGGQQEAATATTPALPELPLTVPSLGGGAADGSVGIAALDCTAEKATWQNLFNTGVFNAALVDPYLASTSPRRLTTAAWSTAMPAQANAFPGASMRVDFNATSIRFGNCGGTGQEVTLTVLVTFSALSSEAQSLMPLTMFTVALDLPLRPGATVDRTNPFRTAQASSSSFKATWSLSQDIQVAIPTNVWSDYLATARDPWMPPSNGCESANYFWKDLYFKKTFRATVNDNNMIISSPIRLKTDAWLNDVPEIPNRYPGQEMELLHETDPLEVSCPAGQPVKVTMVIRTRWFAVFNDQYSPLFSSIVSLPVDTTLRLNPANIYSTTVAPLFGTPVKGVRGQLIETFVDQFDIGVLNNYWYFLLQKQ